MQFALGILLARLLPPRDFGLIALAMVIVGFTAIVADLGIGPALIHRAELSERLLRAGFTISVAFGLLATGVVLVAAPLAADLLNSPAVGPVLRVLGTSFTITAVAIPARALLQRRLDFRRIFLTQVVAYSIAYACLALPLALTGFGVWSLVWGTLAHYALDSLISLRMSPVPCKPLLAKEEFRELIGFGAGATLNGTVAYFGRNADTIVVGRVLGEAALGLYGRAYGLMLLPTMHLSRVMSAVLFPAFSAMRGDTVRLRRAYLSLVQLTALLTAPTMSGIIVAAPHLFVGLYGPAWAGAVIPLQILCVGGVFRGVYNLSSSVTLATGTLYRELPRQLVYALLVGAGSVVGALAGINGVAAGVLLAIAYMYVAMAQLTSRVIGVRCSEFVMAQVPGVLVGVGVGTLALSVRIILEQQGAGSLVIFGAIALTCAISLPLSIYLLPASARPTQLFARFEKAIAVLPRPIGSATRAVFHLP